MTTVLVTGATGFVGSHALEALAAHHGLRVIAACRDPKRLPHGFRGEVRSGDLRDAGYVARALEGVDTVCHAAAWTSAWNHARESQRLFLQPAIGFIHAARRAGVRRFVNLSTTSAAAPERSADPLSTGIERAYWPHLVNVVRIEELLRTLAGPGFTAVNLRCGLFAGQRYALGLLPLLVPRLKTHLVPWVAGGRTGLPIVAGPDLGAAFALAATAPGLSGYEGFNIVGPEVPSARQVIDFLHAEYGVPRPHFGVSFALAYAFAWLMEKLDPLVPWEPLVTRSIVHLLEETHADNARAEHRLGYRPTIGWRRAIRMQMTEMQTRQARPMRMHKPVEP